MKCKARGGRACGVTALHENRRGVSLAVALVLLALISLLAFAVVSAHTETRRLLLRRWHGRQADYLAQAGVELALAELLAGRAVEFRETYEPIDGATVVVAVTADAERPDQVQIHSAAVYPGAGAHRAGRDVRRIYRMVRDDEGGLLECVFVAGRSTRQPQYVGAGDPRHREGAETVHAEKLAVLRRMLQLPPKPINTGDAVSKPQNMVPGKNLGGPEIVPLLIELLKDDDAAVRALAAEALGTIGPDSRLAVPALRKALQDDDVKVRVAASAALQQTGTDTAERDRRP